MSWLIANGVSLCYVEREDETGGWNGHRTTSVCKRPSFEYILTNENQKCKLGQQLMPRWASWFCASVFCFACIVTAFRSGMTNLNGGKLFVFG